jgi:hypothetical protein
MKVGIFEKGADLKGNPVYEYYTDKGEKNEQMA